MTLPVKKAHGRPRLDPTDTTEGLKVRFPTRELERVRQAAGRAGLSMGEFVRQVVMDATVAGEGEQSADTGAPSRPEPAHVHKAGEMRSGGIRRCLTKGCTAVKVEGRWVES